MLYGDRWREFTPLTETERFDILRAAIGYSLGEEPIGLARFRERYPAKMADTPDRRAFDVVSAPVGSGSAEFQDIAKKVAGADSLEAFLRDMRTRYPDSGGDLPRAASRRAAAAGLVEAAAPGRSTRRQAPPSPQPPAADRAGATARLAARPAKAGRSIRFRSCAWIPACAEWHATSRSSGSASRPPGSSRPPARRRSA